ncbi:MAG TPA: hypothetical protein VHZ51_19030 [Ktedonobacteraceae bacterium]|nr:hypothetical protein [Ktedonobacteraceae bacterium]
MYVVTAELVAEYASLFVHCWDYYAVQQRDGSYRPTYQPLTLVRLADHLCGRYTLGTYSTDRAGYCAWAVFDADEDDGLERLVLLAEELAGSGVASVLEASRRGGHLWVFLVQPTPAWVMRRWLLSYALAFGVELYPKQDELRTGGVGNLVRLPLGVHRQSGGWYPFVLPESYGKPLAVGETVADCCRWLGEQEDPRELVGASAVRDRPGRGAIRAWCRTQDIGEIIGRYVALNARGIGRCPLPGHHYRGDVRPSLQVFGGDGREDPHWYCYTWGRAGDLFDFLCLYHGVSVQEAWHRLQQGTLG